jgi:hypothetical protein
VLTLLTIAKKNVVRENFLLLSGLLARYLSVGLIDERPFPLFA